MGEGSEVVFVIDPFWTSHPFTDSTNVVGAGLEESSVDIGRLRVTVVREQRARLGPHIERSSLRRASGWSPQRQVVDGAKCGSRCDRAVRGRS